MIVHPLYSVHCTVYYTLYIVQHALCVHIPLSTMNTRWRLSMISTLYSEHTVSWCTLYTVCTHHHLLHEHKTTSLDDFDVVHCLSMILTVNSVHCVVYYTVYIVQQTLCVHIILSTMNTRRRLSMISTLYAVFPSEHSMILVDSVHCTAYIVHYTLCECVYTKTLSTMNTRRSLISRWFQRCTHRCTWVYKLLTV